MNNTPTPRTDRLEYEQECNFEVAWEDECRRLERELAAVTEQRDRLAEALNKYRGQVDNEGNHSAPEAIQSLNQNVKVHTPLPATASDETGVKP